jgi:hypothetical protein
MARRGQQLAPSILDADSMRFAVQTKNRALANHADDGKERFNNGSPRNCKMIGNGSYTITTLSDARVLAFENLPSQTRPLTFTRVLVERGGSVFAGFRNKPTVGNSARLNMAATNALLAQLGLPTEDPAQPFTLSAMSYQGTWDARDATSPVGSPRHDAVDQWQR